MKKSIKYLLPISMFIFMIYLTAFTTEYNPVFDYQISENDSVMNDSINTEIIDMTAHYIKLNNDPKNKPSTNFRSGHVNPREIKKDYFKKTDYGYVISMGSYTNVPTPAVDNGVVYVSGGFGSKQYYAFDVKSGQSIWAVDLDDDGPSSPAVKDSIIVFNTESCTIFACNKKTGKQIWSYWMGDPLMSMPTIANGIVFSAYPAGFNGNINMQQQKINNIQQNNIKITGNSLIVNDSTMSINTSHVFIAFDLYTGKILWQSRIDGDVMSAPVAKDDFVYVTTFPGTLFKFKQTTGEIVSVKAMRATSAPVIYEDNIFISRRTEQAGEYAGEGIMSFSYANGKKAKLYNKRKAPYLDKNIQGLSDLKTSSMTDDAGNGFVGGAPSSSGWYAASVNVGQSNVSSLQSFQGSRTLHRDGRNYNTMGDELICTDIETGKVVWKHKIKGDLNSVGGFIGTPPLSVANYIIIATYSGEIIISDVNTGKEIEKYEINEPIRYQPVVDNGWIFVTSTTGKLHAINTGNKKITGWSHWGADAARTNIVK